MPVILTRDEVRALMARLMDETGMRPMEPMRLRVGAPGEGRWGADQDAVRVGCAEPRLTLTPGVFIIPMLSGYVAQLVRAPHS